MAQIACEEGVEQATVTRVAARVRVARRTFYDLFADRQDCLRALVKETVDAAAQRVRIAYAADAPWRARLRAGVFELLALVDEDRALARLCMVQLYSDDEVFSGLRRQLVESLLPSVEQGRVGMPVGVEPPPHAGEGALGAAGWILYTRLLDDPHTSVLELLGPLMSVLVLPFVGPSLAHHELSRPTPARVSPAVPVAERADAPSPDRPSFRVTYRTARVLEVIAATPQASNRAVAQEAGIKDQGQVSKLLARLERAGLIENTGGTHGANAWQLTAEGRELLRTIAVRAPNSAV